LYLADITLRLCLLCFFLKILLFSASLWQIPFYISINGEPLNSLVDVPINVTKFNSLITQNLTADWAAVDIPSNGTVAVSDTLKVYVTGVLSRLDWDNITLALTAALSSVQPSGNNQQIHTPETWPLLMRRQ
jgi:hypothetical protein